ncbi:MAG: hypothetical protein M9962_03030 [Oligoflexia bacterium]|nr:hypothetical protein [Oligoflexia bacterium]
MLKLKQNSLLSVLVVFAVAIVTVGCKVDAKKLNTKKNDPGIDGNAVVEKQSALILGGSEELTKICKEQKGIVSPKGDYCVKNIYQKNVPPSLPLYSQFSLMTDAPAGVAVFIEGKDIPGGSLQLAVDGNVLASLPASTRHIVIPNKGEVQLLVITNNYSGVTANIVQCLDHNLNNIICPTIF